MRQQNLSEQHGPVKFKKAVTPDELRHANYELKGAKGDKEARKIAMRLGVASIISFFGRTNALHAGLTALIDLD